MQNANKCPPNCVQIKGHMVDPIGLVKIFGQNDTKMVISFENITACCQHYPSFIKEIVRHVFQIGTDSQRKMRIEWKTTIRRNYQSQKSASNI